MELPFYDIKSFHTFYYLNLEHFVKIFPSAREEDFLNELKKNYLLYTRVLNGKRVFNNLIFIKEFTFSEREGFNSDDTEVEISMFAHIVDSYFKHYLPFAGNPFLMLNNSFFGNEKKILDDDNSLQFSKQFAIDTLFEKIDLNKHIKDFKKPSDYKLTHQKYLLDKTIHIEYFKYLYYENGEIKGNENMFKDFGFAVLSILDEIEKKIKIINQENNYISENNYKLTKEVNVSTTFKNSDFTKENLIFNILLFFDLLKELTDFLSPITTEKDLEYVRKNKNKIFEIEDKLNKSDIKRYFMLFNQIQNRDDRLPFLKNIHSFLKELKTFWGLRYNDEVFAKARDFNVFWNESEFRNTIYRVTYNIKELDTFLSKLINELEDSKSERVESKISIETPENDFSNNEDKEKLIILEKLKIIDYIKSIQTKPETISHTAEILSAITGINSTTLYTYLRPMLNANRDDNDKNSPYKNRDNVLNANKTIQKLKIKNTDANN